MPQFDTTFFSGEVFWTIISFALLFVVLTRWILPRIASILMQRTQLINDEISAARKQHQEADSLRIDYENKLAKIEHETKIMFDESEKRLIERRKILMDECKEEMERKKQALKEDTELMRQQAVRDVRLQTADLIVAATEQLIHQKISGDEAQKVLEETIDALAKSDLK